MSSSSSSSALYKSRKNHHQPQQQQQQQQQGANRGGNRFLITVNVLGSAGPIRFLVNEEELVATVIHTALRSYAREGRLPVLGSDLNNFLLYCANAGTDALSPWEPIGSQGSRNFVLCKKQKINGDKADERSRSPIGVLERKGNGSWKAWLNKSLSFKISSH